jgi:hypothetical protein
VGPQWAIQNSQLRGSQVKKQAGSCGEVICFWKEEIALFSACQLLSGTLLPLGLAKE